MKNKENQVEKIIVDFYEADAGWIRFNVKVGEQLFYGRFSEVFDPILDFKKWLEALAIGVQQASFRYDSEGFEIVFDLEKINRHKDIFTIYDPDDGEIYIKTYVNRKQLVKEFYFSLINFSKSEKYNPKEWEIEYLKERICNELKISEDELINYMLELDRKELKKFLFNADPVYKISFPDAKDKNEEFKLFVDSVIGGEKAIEGHKIVRIPEEKYVPEDYDYWLLNQKRDFIIKCLNERTTGGFSGTKLSEFHSQIIGKYLYEREI